MFSSFAYFMEDIPILVRKEEKGMEQKVRRGVMRCAGIVAKRFLPAMEAVINGRLCAIAVRSAENNRRSAAAFCLANPWA